MKAARTTPKPAMNRLLSALPVEARTRIAANLAPVSLEFKQPIYGPGEPIRHVYFPTSGILSIVMDMDDGATVEVATVGAEGMVGLPVFLGADKMPGRALCQIPGEALRMEAAVFRDEVDQVGPLHSLLLKYTQAMLNFVAQTAACNRAHSVEERCERWLLITQD